MINIVIEKKEGIKIKAEGHSLFEEKGKDIVCASVSVLLQMWLIGMKEIAKANVDFVKNSGFLSATVDRLNEKGEVLFDNLVLSLGILEHQYPERIRLILEE
ncbi:MAG: ribosomal-processing cysteine protease Prp [Brevinematia bacterium]